MSSEAETTQASPASATRKVVWIQNKGNNTGRGGGLASMIPSMCDGQSDPSAPGGILVEKVAGEQLLQSFLQEKGWVEYDCPLANFLYGQPTIKIWAAKLDPAKEHRGKNSVVATYLASEMDGLALGTICGQALMSASDSTADVTYDQVLKMVMYMNDMIEHFGGDGVRNMLQNAQALFPHYDVSKTHTFCSDHITDPMGEELIYASDIRGQGSG